MNPHITKEEILQQIDPQDIFLKFLGLTEIPRGNISSPFAQDKNPSFKIYPETNTFKCFSTGNQGDVFQLVASLNNLDCKTNFTEVLSIIKEEMLLNTSKTNLQSLKVSKPKPNVPVATDPKKVVLNIEEKPMAGGSLFFWENLGVNETTLDNYNVKAIQSFTFYNTKREAYTTQTIKENIIAFAYEMEGNFEIYIPKQAGKNQKFFCNGLKSDDVYGLDQIQEDKVNEIIICAGKKDVVIASSRGFNAVTFRSENILPTKEQIEILSNKCSKLYLCYDNDKGGEAGAKKIIENYPHIKQIHLPKKFNDICDYFQEDNPEDFRLLIDSVYDTNNNKTDKKETTTIFHITEEYLNEHYDLRYNVISLDIEISEKNKNDFKSCNENSLWLELQKKSIKIPINSLIAILKSDLIPKYNPILEYYESLPEWDKKTDYITEFSKYVKLKDDEDQEQFEYHFKKWCVRVVKCALIDGYFNKQAFVLTDDGRGQNIGKSSWCRFLCPPELSEYIAEDMGDDKDSRILLCKNILINLDELAALSKKEINQLKAHFSKSQINERLPYDRKNSIIQRIASFIGSTNMSEFLHDETGSVRWLCFVVKSLDWKYSKEFNIDELWSQAYALSKDETFIAEMTKEDIEQNEIRNEKFQIATPEKELIQKHFEKALNTDEGEFYNSTRILKHINFHNHGFRLSSVGIGKALKSLGYARAKYKGSYGYWVKILDVESETF